MLNEKLCKIQKELKAPKNRTNSFGKYNYRSCEDILEAVKPLLFREGLLMRISDEIVEVGGRNYIRATVEITDGKEKICNTAFAREAEEKKGMDEAQITGTASSYARKYCLNGLFLIDDVKDADTDEYQMVQNPKITKTQAKSLRDKLKNDGLKEENLCELYKVSVLEDFDMKMFRNALDNWDKVKERIGGSITNHLR